MVRIVVHILLVSQAFYIVQSQAITLHTQTIYSYRPCSFFFFKSRFRYSGFPVTKPVDAALPEAGPVETSVAQQYVHTRP